MHKLLKVQPGGGNLELLKIKLVEQIVTVKEPLCGVQKRKHNSCGLSLKEQNLKTDLQASSNSPYNGSLGT
jgi:hypothetical protein